MNIVITGGFGFIGSNLMSYYLKKGDNVTVIDNLSTSSNQHVSSICSDQCFNTHKLKFISLDLSEEGSKTSNAWREFRECLSRSDVVYHLAGSVGVRYIDNDPRGTLQNTFKINNNMFPLFECNQCKVIFASTSEVYGDTNNAKETDKLSIGPPTTLRWGYACSKLMSEFLLRTYTFPSIVTRFFNVTGKGQLPDHGMVLPSFIQNAKEHTDIIIHGDGKQTRTFCDIRDAVEMLVLLAQDSDHIDQIYNIGNPNNTITIHDLATLVIEMTSSKSKIKFTSYQDSFSNEFGEIFHRKPDTEKIEKIYKSKYNIEDIINSMI